MDESYCLSLLLFFVPFVSLSLFLVLFYRHRSPFTAPNLPPGRMGYPLIGETLEFMPTGSKGPKKFIVDRMIKYSSQLFKTSIIGQPTVVFCGAAANKFLFSNENKLVTTWWPDTVNKIFLSNVEGNASDEVKRMRHLVLQFFKPEALQRYVGAMDTIAQRHFGEHWDNNTEVTVFPTAKRYTFSLACRLLMSIEDGNHVAKFADAFKASNAGILSLPIDLPGTAFNKAIKAAKVIKKELLEIIRQRKVDLAEGNASPTQDILSQMLLTCNEDGQYMNELVIAERIIGFVLRGYETASTTCTFIVKYLAEFPHIYDNVYQDDVNRMRYTWNVACEALRLAPPTQGTFREAMNDFIFNGFSIPKGWKLYWSAHSTHRSPEYFPEPEKFDPSRYEGHGPAPFSFVPFGGGPRICPGREFARFEILVFIHNLVKRFKWEKLIPDEKIVFTPLPKPAKNLPIRLYPHKA